MLTMHQFGQQPTASSKRETWLYNIVQEGYVTDGTQACSIYSANNNSIIPIFPVPSPIPHDEVTVDKRRWR